MEDLQILNFCGVDCYEKDGVAYLKLENVARGLGFTRVAESGNEVIRWERVNGYLKDLGVPTCGHEDFIPENIFYRLAMKAKNETADKFQAKVADEIIPSIRKHGAYMTEKTLEKALTSPDFLIQLATQLKEEKEKNRQLETENKEMKPKAIFADAVSESKTSILVGDLAKLICQNGVRIGQKRLFEYLREKGYLIKSGSSKNMPQQRYLEQWLFEIKESNIQNPDGSIRITKTTKVTGKGQQYFVNKFLAKV